MKKREVGVGFRKHFRSRKIYKIISMLCVFSQMVLCLSFSVNTAAERQSVLAAELLLRMEQADESEKIPVTLWIEDIDCDEEKIAEQANTVVNAIKNSANATKLAVADQKLSSLLSSGDDPSKLNEPQIYIEAKRKIYSDLYTRANAKVTNTLLNEHKTLHSSQITWVSKYTPVVKMELTRAQIVALSQNALVEAVYLDNHEVIIPEIPDVEMKSGTNGITPASVWQQTTNITHVKSLGFDGSGVKVGLFDTGVLRYADLEQNYKNVFTTLYNDGRLIADPDAPTEITWHAAYCGSIIAATNGSVPGIAPGVTLYSTSGTNRIGQAEGAIEWLISKGCRIISMSVCWDGYNEYSYMSRWLDHIAIQHDVTTIKAAGNYGELGVGGGSMSYNSIVVGASDDMNTISRTDDVRKSDSSFFSGSAPLAIKPDIMAPATNIQIPAANSAGQTSIATPQVAGITALLYEMRPSLESNQAATKAILLAGISPCGALMGESVAGSTQTAMNTRTGAGLVDAKAVRYVAQNNRFVGATMGSGTTVYTETFTVSASDTLTRVCLTWLKNNRVNGSHTTNPNVSIPDCPILYLQVKSPSGIVYRSQSAAGNVQLISFEPPETGPYTITVTKNYAPSSEANVYFGLAWY